MRRGEKDKAFFDDAKVKFPDSQVKNYHYTPLFYGKTRGNSKMDDGRYAYVPYLVLVGKEVTGLEMPTSQLTILNPSSGETQNIVIQRLNKNLLKNSPNDAKPVSALDIINASKASTSVSKNAPI